MKIKHFVINIIKLLYLLCIFVSAFYLFYCQVFAFDGRAFLSDLPDHIELARAGDSYSVMYIVMGMILDIPYGTYVLFAFQALLVLGSGWFGYKMIREELALNQKDIAFFAGFSLIFLTSMYIPDFSNYYYKGSLITQPWHNITYIGMRFFALWAIYNFFKVYERYLKGIGILDWFKMAVPLLIATSIKPNFLLSFSFTLLIILVIDFIRDYRNFWNIVKMGTVVFPSCLVLIIQAIILYGPTEEGMATSSVIITWGESLYKEGLALLLVKMFCGLAFPILIYILHRKDFDRKAKFVYLMFLVTFVQVNFLGEDGVRATHGNFTWGIYCAAFNLFIYALIFFIREFNVKGRYVEKVIGSIFLVLHIISGYQYYRLLLEGGMSYNL